MDRETWLQRQANIRVIEAGSYTHAVTFNTNKNLTVKRTTTLFELFERRLAKKINDKRKFKFVGFYERKSGNAHIHSVVNFTKKQEEQFNKHAPHIWAKLMRENKATGRLWVDLYKDSVATYITKEGAMVITTA